MKKIWGKRIGTGVLAISLMLSSLPTQLSIALPHKAKAADTEFKSEAFDYGKLPDSTAAKITRKSLTGREWTGEDNNLDITSVNTLPDSSNLVPYADIASAYAGAKDYARGKSSYYRQKQKQPVHFKIRTIRWMRKMDGKRLLFRPAGQAMDSITQSIRIQRCHLKKVQSFHWHQRRKIPWVFIVKLSR